MPTHQEECMRIARDCREARQAQQASDFRRTREAQERYQQSRNSLAAQLYQSGVAADEPAARKMVDKMTDDQGLGLDRAAAARQAGLPDDEPKTPEEQALALAKHKKAVAYATEKGVDYKTAVRAIEQQNTQDEKNSDVDALTRDGREADKGVSYGRGWFGR